MKIVETRCKTALSKSNLPGLDYSLNPYKGCEHNCAYCYVPNILRIKRQNWGNFVEIKTNIPNVLSKELKKVKSGVVGISTVTDPYQPTEKKYKLTRYCLEQLLIYDSSVHIQTKSSLIYRDVDLISKLSNIEVMFSIGTINDSERKILEPKSSTIEKRLETLKKLSDIGIKTSIFFGPIYPSVNLKNISEIIDVFLESDVKEIMLDKLNIKPGISSSIDNRLLLHKWTDFSSGSFNKNYLKIRDEIKTICKQKNVIIQDAF